MVFQRSMLNWRRGWGQSAMGICVLCYIWKWFGVMVFQRSMLNSRRGSGVSLPWVYVHCAIFIWNLFGVMVFQRSMLDLEEGVGSTCHGYMCIVLYIYMKLIWCNGFPEISAWLMGGRSASISAKVWCSIIQGIYAQLTGVDLPADLPSLV